MTHIRIGGRRLALGCLIVTPCRSGWCHHLDGMHDPVGSVSSVPLMPVCCLIHVIGRCDHAGGPAADQVPAAQQGGHGQEEGGETHHRMPVPTTTAPSSALDTTNCSPTHPPTLQPACLLTTTLHPCLFCAAGAGLLGRRGLPCLPALGMDLHHHRLTARAQRSPHLNQQQLKDGGCLNRRREPGLPHTRLPRRRAMKDPIAARLAAMAVNEPRPCADAHQHWKETKTGQRL